MDRDLIDNRTWELIVPFPLRGIGWRGRLAPDSRPALEGVLWITRTGAPGGTARAVRPMEFKREAGDPVDRLQRETVRRRFARWRDTGTFETLLDDPANGGAGNDVLQMIDSAVI